MSRIKRIKFLGTKDRIGMVYDVLKAAVSAGINIITMEVNPFICFKIEWDDTMSWQGFVKYMKSKITEIEDIVELDMMDYEQREKELYALINSIDEGIISTDENGQIIHYNQRAQAIFADKEIYNGCGIGEFIPINIVNLKLVQDNLYNIEVVYKHNKKENLLMDIMVIKNEFSKITGYLIIFKEMEKVRRLMHSLTGPSMNTFEDIIGESQSIRNAKAMAIKIASSNSNVLLIGESGTGKELFARAIHISSRRADYPFVTANCAAIPDSLLESEFFGYARGAFTGASQNGKQGLFELATRGTIFLDEIGDMASHLQAKILRAIQENKIRRVGGINEIDIDARIISATNRNLEAMVKEGSFRQDLYFRLNVIPIYIPPLRERKSDIPILINHFMNKLKKEHDKPGLEFAKESLQQLISFEWPGNIRELRNVLERAVSLASDKVQPQHLMLKKDIEEKEHVLEIDQDIRLPIHLQDIIRDIEKKYILRASQEYKSSREIAKVLGISHTSVIQKLKKYHIRM